MKNPLNLIAALGLALGAIFGLLGSIVTSQTTRAISWEIDSVGLIVATVLLTLKYLQQNKIFLAAGFLVFAIGEAVILSATAASLDASVPAFAAGAILWSAALLLISIPRHFALITRVTGIIAAILFSITATTIFAGVQLTPIAQPLPFFAYPFFVMTLIGWIWTVLRADS